MVQPGAVRHTSRMQLQRREATLINQAHSASIRGTSGRMAAPATMVRATQRLPDANEPIARWENEGGAVAMSAREMRQ